MMRILITICFIALIGVTHGQKLNVKETWASGYARSVLFSDRYDNSTETDTVTASRLMSGHTLVDVAANIKPSEKVYIHAMLRVRNDHGGFWGSGVTFDLRNMYLRGLIGKGFRYQVGDIQYKLTPYTFFNSDEELSMNEAKVFGIFREMVHTDLFYDDQNTWRQQGLTGEFGLRFKKGIEEMDFTMFSTRLGTSFGGGALDRIHTGGSVFLKQSDFLDFRLNYVDVFDILGTSASTDRLFNPVLTGGFGLHKDLDEWSVDLMTEFGKSSLRIRQGEDYMHRKDYFRDVDLHFTYNPANIKVRLGFQEVGPGFRSIGAQTKRISFGSPALAYQRYGNEQALRPLGMLDIMRDASIYNVELRDRLMAFDPSYGNAMPFGEATPNRRNLSIAMDWEDDAEQVKLTAGHVLGSEVIGSGTTILKNFGVTTARADVMINKFIGTEKDWSFMAGLWNESTKRTGGESFEEVDLVNMKIDLGMSYEFAEGFEALFGYSMLDSEGNEQLAIRDENDNIILFEDYSVDRKQEMYGLGLRYNFTDNSMLTIQGMAFDYSDDSEFVEDYTIDNLSLIYRMKF